jgi:hypothetical protein
MKYFVLPTRFSDFFIYLLTSLFTFQAIYNFLHVLFN